MDVLIFQVVKVVVVVQDGIEGILGTPCRGNVTLFSSHPFRNSSKILTKPSTIGFGEIHIKGPVHLNRAR